MREGQAMDQTLAEYIQSVNDALEELREKEYVEAIRATITGENVGNSDNVNSPKHYIQGSIECIDALEAATMGKQGIEAVCVANVIKYLWRYEEKNGLEDVRKAQWYLNKLIERMGDE